MTTLGEEAISYFYLTSARIGNMSVAAACLHGAQKCLIPSAQNDHRPYVLRPKPLWAITSLLIASKVLALGVLLLTPASANLSTITEGRIIQLTNQERQKAGAEPLVANSRLNQAAAQKGQHMLEEDYFAHISPSGVTPWFWIDKTGYAYKLAGENLAIDFFEAEDVVRAWMNSPSHKENMLHTDYTETGVAVVSGEFQGGTSIIVVHLFGRPTVAAAQTQTETPAESPPATPVPVAPPKTPRIPRIALADNAALVRDTVGIAIEGEAGSKVRVLVNEKVAAVAILPPNELVEVNINLNSYADGALNLQAYSFFDEAAPSQKSNQVLAVKDTEAPALKPQDFTFIVSPLTDLGQALVLSEVAELSSPANGTLIPLNEEPQIIARDAAGNETKLELKTLLPTFAKKPVEVTTAPAALSQLVRRMALGIAISLLIILGLAVAIRVRIQHPELIAHSLLVLVLASWLFFL
jgi:hypothetical protein